jgi:hypothetical protein
MQSPNVVTTRKISDLNTTFHIYAYRKLTDDEILLSIRQWMRHSRYKRLPKNTIIKIQTIIGFDPQGGL